MRTFKKMIFASMLFALVSVSVFGTTPSIKVRNYDSKKFFVIVNGSDNSQISVILRDKNDVQLYQESYKNENGYAKGFNVESLPSGNYMLEVENETRMERFTISIQKNKLQIDDQSKLVIMKPNVNQDGNKVDVAYLKYDNKPVRLSIVNTGNDVIFRETVAQAGLHNKTYDLSKLTPGSYTLRFDIAGNYFNHTIRIQ